MIVAMTAADLVKWIAWGPVRVRRIQGWNNNAASVYIQFHQTPPASYVGGVSTLTASQVPAVKSFVATANNGFDYEWVDGLELNELTIGLSTSEVNFTSVGAGAGLDMAVWIDTECAVDSKTFLTGDLTTGVDFRSLWADSVNFAGARLFRVDYVNNDGATRWLTLVADVNGSTSAIFESQVASSGTAAWFFGSNGTYVFTIDATRTKHYGGVVLQSSVGTSIQVTSSAVSCIRVIGAAP